MHMILNVNIYDFYFFIHTEYAMVISTKKESNSVCSGKEIKIMTIFRVFKISCKSMSFTSEFLCMFLLKSTLV